MKKKWSNPELKCLNLEKTEDIYRHRYKCVQCNTTYGEEEYITGRPHELPDNVVCKYCGGKFVMVYRRKVEETGQWDCPCDGSNPALS